MKTNSIYLVIVLSFLVGCSTAIDSALSTRGVIREEKSKFDGTRVVTMSPALPKHGMSDIQAEFGLYWDSAKRDNALLIVQVDGAQNFEPNKPFEIRVDGEHYKLPPASSKDFGEVETLRDSVVGAHNKSSKAYIINKDQILKIANGKETAYRVWFLRDKIADGEVSYQYQDYQSYVPHSFRRFHSQVWKQR